MSNITTCLIKLKKYDLWDEDQKTFNKKFLKWSLKNHPDKLSSKLSQNEKQSKSRLYQEILDCRNMIITNFSKAKKQNYYTTYIPSSSDFDWKKIFNEYNKKYDNYSNSLNQFYFNLLESAGLNFYGKKNQSKKKSSKPKSSIKKSSKPKSSVKKTTKI